MNRKIIVILGPTASGKSSLGVALAKKFHGVVLSADSRQVYKGMNVGTAKITKREMNGVPHYLLDIASPRRTFTVAQFQHAARRFLKTIPAKTPIFIVGGSPFYIEAILNPRPYPAVKPNSTFRHRLAQMTSSQLMALLRRRDPRRAADIDPHNKRRLIRALEIIAALGTVPPRRTATRARVLKIGIALDRHKLYQQIDRRVDSRLPAMMREVRTLHRAGLSWKRLDDFGLEYRWIGRTLQKKTTRNEGVERLKGDIHSFARRQLTWWRRDREIIWINNNSQARRLVRKFLNKKSRYSYTAEHRQSSMIIKE